MLYKTVDQYILDLDLDLDLGSGNEEEEKRIDLEAIFADGEFTPSALEQKIPMDSEELATSTAASAIDHIFPYERIMDLIVYNLLKQKVRLPVTTWKSIIKFFKTANFESRSSGQIPLEILLVVSKLNADEIAFYKMPLSRDDVYNDEMAGAAESANTVVTDAKQTSIFPLTDETVAKIKKFLNLDSIIDAIYNCLKELFVEGEIVEPEAKRKHKESGGKELTKNWIRNEIEKMRIYATTKFGNLKGVTLTDGFLICTDGLVPEVKSQQRHDADLYCLSIHELSHFLARRFVNDYNFSSPSKGTELSVVEDRISTDIVVIPAWKGLEFGRQVELLLFDGVQPTWQRSRDHTGLGLDYPDAAALFIERAHSRKECPPALISKGEHKKYRLIYRLGPSVSFAGDLREYVDFYL